MGESDIIRSVIRLSERMGRYVAILRQIDELTKAYTAYGLEDGPTTRLLRELIEMGRGAREAGDMD